MKRLTFVNLSALCLVLALGSVGCKHKQKGVTPIPGSKTAVTGPGAGGLMSGGQVPGGSGLPTGPDTSTIPAVPLVGPEGTLPTTASRLDQDRPMDRELFKAQTVHFDFDRSAVRPDQRIKIDEVAEAFKKMTPENDLLIEGYCDERGTEQYNMSLGERRALAIREYLVNLGISGDRIQTKSWGEEKPVDPGHNEAAWAKNRRGEFVVLLPRAKP
jgi:peptidoglycan-associated lipoprotein